MTGIFSLWTRPTNRSTVVSPVAYVDGEFTLKRVRIGRDAVELVAANPKYKNIRITPDNDFAVWGVVRWILKSV